MAWESAAIFVASLSTVQHRKRDAAEMSAGAANNNSGKDYRNRDIRKKFEFKQLLGT